MNNKLTVSFALLAGLAGGMLTRFIAPAPVFAQAPVQILPAPAPATSAPVTREIRAESFALVDQYDNVVGTFAAEPTGPPVRMIPRGFGAPVQRSPMRIVLRDSYGHEIWSAGGSAIRPLMSTVR
jgi:hypothetical protein